MPERLTRIALHLAGVGLELNLSDPLQNEVKAVFGDLMFDQVHCHVHLSASLEGNRVEVRPAGQSSWSCDHSEFVPLVKALLIDSVLRLARYHVALHAAALIRHGRALLLVGSPGAGKTTLAATLARLEFGLLADDVVLLGDGGLMTGLALPFTVKETAWPILSSDWAEIQDAPAYRRPDGINVRYLRHDPVVDASPQSIDSVILLDRANAQPAVLHEVSPVCALEALIAEGDTRDERLTEAGFTSLVTALREARCFRLSYSDRHEAAEAVAGLFS